MSTQRFLPPDLGHRDGIATIKNVLYFIIGAAAVTVAIELLWGVAAVFP